MGVFLISQSSTFGKKTITLYTFVFQICCVAHLISLSPQGYLYVISSYNPPNPLYTHTLFIKKIADTQRSQVAYQRVNSWPGSSYAILKLTPENFYCRISQTFLTCDPFMPEKFLHSTRYMGIENRYTNQAFNDKKFILKQFFGG